MESKNESGIMEKQEEVMRPFVHLHNHTAYSLLDGASKISEMIERAKELNQPALAITDHGVMYGVVDFYKACKKAGVKPIIGCEVYVAPRTRFDKQAGLDDSAYHLVLLVKNEQGYRNLSRLESLASLDGFYYKPRVDREILEQYHEGLIALSGCLAGEVAQKILQEDLDGAREAAQWYQKTFGADNYYFEVQNHGMHEQIQINYHLNLLSKELGVPLVATNDNHYVYREDAKTQDVMMCIQMGKTMDDASRMKFEGDHFYLKSYDEMQQILGDYPESLTNTLKIADQCDFNFTFGENHMPIFDVPDGYTLDSYFEELCWQEIQTRYNPVTEEVKQRLEYELSVIKQMGYSGYFLIVWDFIRFAREKGIYVGPGRGSAAGSIVSYALHITDIDPLKYDLLFERFLNPERVSMPDIDIDFCYERRGEVIDYVIEKYGQDHVCQIITFGTMAARGAIRDVGRVLNIPIATVNKVSKAIPNELGMTIEKALKASAELRSYCEEDEQIAELIATAQKLEGLPRHAGTHAAGVVISKDALDFYLPLQKSAECGVITQFAKENVEEIGLLKMDFLGLRTLTVINKAVDMIKANHGVSIDFNTMPMDDKKTYQLLCDAESIGVFQLESGGLRAIMKELQPNDLEDVIALVALYRPGPLNSGMADDFIERKHGRKEIEYLHPLLEPILKPTYGVILYQEQVMRIASDLAGFSLGQADMLRRAMGKKKPEIIAAMKQDFLDGAEKTGVDRAIAAKVFELIEYFAGYGFNKSHSAAYAVVAYQTAYLKAHYPVEFMAALLTSVMDSADRVSFYIAECKRMGIPVLTPDVNESQENFTVHNGRIRFGLAAMKNVGKGAMQSIIQIRNEDGPFASLQDFCARVDLSQVNKRMVENLIKGGAFGSVAGNKRQLLMILDMCLEQGHEIARSKSSAQISLFDLDEEQTGLTSRYAPIPLPDIPEFSAQELLAMEKQILGLYVSGHPLDDYTQVISEKTSITLSELTEEHDQQRIVVAGMINNFKISTTKKGDTMATCQFEDLTGSMEMLVFPKTFVRYREMIEKDAIVLVKGRFLAQDDNPKLSADEILPLPDDKAWAEQKAKGQSFARSVPDHSAAENNYVPDTAPYNRAEPRMAEPAPQVASLQEVAKKQKKKLYLRLTAETSTPQVQNRLKTILRQHNGPMPVFFYFSEQKKMVLAEYHYWVASDIDLIMALSQILGAENISVKED